MSLHTLKRREFLQGGALALGGAFVTSRLAFAGTGADTKARFVFILMRGALDGLAAVPPYGDPDYAGLRRELALRAPSSSGTERGSAVGGALPLNGFFGLHPSLTFLRDSYVAQELVVFHAIASPYRERSHFDGQDVLESGVVQPHAVQTGWLNRALASMQGQSKELGVALGQNIPLVMRGPASVTSWSPSKLPALDEDTLERITDLYAGDPLLASRLADALAADAIAGESSMDGMPVLRTAGANRQATPAMQASAAGSPTTQGAKPGRYVELVRAVAGFLRRPDGPQVAVFDTTGWDTHANEGAAEGQLAGRLAALDAGLRVLKEELGPTWNNTAVVLATEFGRTAATNGTRGTDHGTATAAFLLGGAVQGGRVIADWLGLSSRALYQGRDLKPTADLRSLLKGVLSEHLLVTSDALETSVFPNSRDAKPVKGLFRA
ncbi:MAG: DUF1501 domain-containing protein [Sinobacteraceae bacterium]|nr:DUF1501 domain-containing protein [Nevskiaceae bacterium]